MDESRAKNLLYSQDTREITIKNWDFYIVSSVFNESKLIETTLGKLDDQIRNGLPIRKVVIVNDGSTDDTAERIKKMSKDYIKLVNKVDNEGFSKGILDGMKKIKELNCGELEKKSLLIKMDLDGEHQPKWIPGLVSDIVEDKADLSVGSICTPPKAGLINFLYHRFFGFFQGKKIVGEPFSQSSPGFLAFKFKLNFLKGVINFLTKYRSKYYEFYGKRDKVGVDLATLTYASEKGLKITNKEFNPGQEKRESKSLNKIISYMDEFYRHMKLLNISSRKIDTKR